MTEDMLINVVEYLDIEDRIRLRQTCAYVNAETKNKVGYLRLNEKYSKEYIMNPAFREEVLRSVANSKKQVFLDINGLKMACTLEDISQVIMSVHRVHLFGIFRRRKIK